MIAPDVPPLEVRQLIWGRRGQWLGGPWTATLGRGEVLAVLGPNGAGKTTLFRALIGSEAAVSGEVLWGGRAQSSLAPGQLAASVAFVPQLGGEAFDLSVSDYVMLGCVARKGWFARPARDDRAVVAGVLERLGLTRLADRPLGRVSGGERQLAGVARALAQQPAVLVLDEPTASLDFGNQESVLAQLASLAADGLTVIFSTHQPNHAQRLASRVLALDGSGPGRYGSAEEILRPELLSALYGVPVRRIAGPEESVFVVGGRGLRGVK